jgi:primosomal protein N' (replication factor Y)
MSHPSQILKVALPVPLRRCFDYLPPHDIDNDKLLPGMRIVVPFGNRQLIGIIIEISSTTNLSVNKLKTGHEVLDEIPVVSTELMRLYQWCASYYQHPLGEVYATALPVLLRTGKDTPREQPLNFIAGDKADALVEKSLKRAPKQARILALIKDHPKGVSEYALKALGLTGAPLKALIDKGLVHSVKLEPTHHQMPANVLAESPLTLNDEQRLALESIKLPGDNYTCHLLEGVTGSGKTEVYLQLIEQVLTSGKTALVLIPEIGLTPQTLARFKHRFNAPIVVLHSHMSNNSRLHDWLAAANGEAGIIIGTRSAIFTPIKSLGVIIVDEEHDLSYKQNDGLRYCARDIAVYRAHQLKIPIVLGSATPSLESLHNVETGRYQHAQLTKRAGDACAPKFELIDIRSRPLQGGLSQPLIEAIRQELDRDNQILVFLNRRGFAPTLMCHECGWIATCNRCETRFTFHSSIQQLRCHHCNKSCRLPPQCPECNNSDLNPVGTGTERSHETIAALFPKSRVIRIDRDTTRQKDAMHDLVSEIKKGEPCILIGTQMLAKGHHFPDVTLVAILEADAGLFSSDFRGLERMGQLIVQVSGRAGRARKQGRVLIQTHQADNPLLNDLIVKGYAALARKLLIERQQAELPPYQHAVIFRAEAVNERDPYAFLVETRQLAERIATDRKISGVDIFGPLPAIMPKRAGRYRQQLMLQGLQRKPLHDLVLPLSLELETMKTARKVRWSIDVDPQESF